MCDYSLELMASRPAKVGDKLVSTRFPDTITRGFAAADDKERNVAVCLLPGTELAFAEEVTSTFGRRRSAGHKVARFRQINQGLRSAYHDALEFPDGQIMLLTDLSEGQYATVLQLPAGEPRISMEDAQREESWAVL
ncbi:MAG: hypothetical protein ACRECX_14110 [Methyloceanibacter sp.]|uniref:hypothetical protein n=1 Tax=Methyloceanibacter sp. TaxID=1965321 RepID=UPI003D6D5E73